MKFPGFGRKDDVVGFYEKYQKQQEVELGSEMPIEKPNSPEERRKKLANRLIILTDRIDELSKNIHNLQQRLEVLEKKGKTSTE